MLSYKHNYDPNSWTDYARGFAVISVIFAHAAYLHVGKFMSYGVVIFPFISGYLFKQTDTITFLKRKWRYLLWYYYIGSVFTILWIILVPSGYKTTSNVEYVKNFLLVRSDLYNAFPLAAVPLWYFVMIFFAELLYTAVQKNTIFKWGFIFLGLISRFFFSGSLPFKIDVTISVLIFIELGKEFRKLKNLNRYFKEMKDVKRIIVIFTSFLLLLLVFNFNGPIDWNSDNYGKYPIIALFGELLALVFAVNFSMILAKFGLANLLMFSSRNIVGMVGYHSFFGYLLYFPLVFLVDNPLLFAEKYWYLSFVSMLTVTYIVFRYSPTFLKRLLIGDFLFSKHNLKGDKNVRKTNSLD